MKVISEIEREQTRGMINEWQGRDKGYKVKL